MAELHKVRIDKWLWSARFFKTRGLAQEAVNGGRAHLNGERVKASRAVTVGDRLLVTKGEYELDVEVVGLAERRVSAKEAALLYTETDASIARRESLREQRRLERASRPSFDHRPDKRERRQIHRFKRSEGSQKAPD